MSTGSSIILVAVMAGMGFVIYKVHQKRKWKLLAKIAGVLFAIGLLVGGGSYAYYWYQNLPYVATQLGEISLGMTPVEVTLQLGKPGTDSTDNLGMRRFMYAEYGSIDYLVTFEKDATGMERVTIVCSATYHGNIFGLATYNSEEDVIRRLGDPSVTSVHKDGLAKMISYEKWKVAFNIQQGDVESICIAASGKVSYAEEYQ